MKRPRISGSTGPRHPAAAQQSPAKSAAKSFPVVGVGASAGGLDEFSQLLAHLPPDTGMGFVLVQHLDPHHESALVQILARHPSMPVREATNDLPVAPNQVYIIPPNTDMTIAKGVLKLQRRKAGRVPHHSIDFFFESLAHDQRECAVGVILSGTASDGTSGMEIIKAEGGITFAQDDSAAYDAMPRSAIAGGCVDFVLSPQNIAKELALLARHPYVKGPFPTAAPSGSDRKSTRLNSSHTVISYAVFCLKKKNRQKAYSRTAE